MEEEPRRYHTYIAICSVLTILCVVWIAHLIHTPVTTPADSFAVAPGDSVRNIAATASAEGYVRSELGFLVWYRLFHNETSILAGQYQLPDTFSLSEFVAILAAGDIFEPQIPITFPEGITIQRMATIIERSDAKIDTDEYTRLLSDKEGYVFPDTYYVTDTTTAKTLVDTQLQALQEILSEREDAIAASDLSEYEIVTLASIVEREANDETSMKMVSGILQNRLAINMPLQADASIEYVLDKPLSELTPKDLEIDSPYNTYVYRGLPPTPINNPGLTAIDAVLAPTPSEYFYYITGNDGVFYYASTFSEHTANINRYLR